MKGRNVLLAVALAVLLPALVLADECPALTLAYPRGAHALLPQLLEEGPSDIIDMEWIGPDNMVIFALTATGHLWRTENGGVTWSDDTYMLQGTTSNNGIFRIMYRPTIPDRVLIIGHASANYGQTLFWVTKNRGVTYEQPCAVVNNRKPCIDVPGGSDKSAMMPTRDIIMHPMLPDVMAAVTLTRTCEDGHSSCWRSDVWSSNDFGSTWHSAMAGYANAAVASVVAIDWAPSAKHGDTAILASAYVTNEDLQRSVLYSGLWDPALTLVISEDFFRTVHTLKRCGNDFEVVWDGTIFLGAAKGCTEPADGGRSVVMFSSRDNGKTWTEACFPTDESENGYMIYDMDRTVFVNVNHNESDDPHMNGAPVGMLYHADQQNSRFTLSRRNVVLQNNGLSDVMPMYGLPGYFASNAIDGAVFGEADFLEKRIDVWDRVQSAISRNDGSSWQALPVPRAPPGDSLPDTCHGLVCNLQVHGPDAWWRGAYNLSYAGFYTHPSAVGMVVTTGNSGAYLSYDPQHVNTYVSNDGGDTFTRVAKGAYIYEFGDWGSILAMAKHAPSGEASEVIFSLDHGRCWSSVQLSRSIEVRNIVTDPRGSGRRFILFGVFNGADGTRKGQGGIYTLNFDDLLAPSNIATCNPSKDYEAWSPAQDCMFGEKLTVLRRKNDRLCLSASNWERAIKGVSQCTCRPEFDFECTYGFERAATGECVPQSDFAPTQNCPDREPAPTRLTAGNKCGGNSDGGNGGGGGGGGGDGGKHKPRNHDGGGRGKGLSGGAIFFIVLLVLFFIALAVVLGAKKAGVRLPGQDHIDGCGLRCVDLFSSLRAKLMGSRPGAATNYDWLEPLEDEDFRPLEERYVPPKL